MNISADISVYTDSSQFMFELGDNKQMDILILDIEMPKMSGFEIADYVKKSNPNCLIIFMTSHVNFTVFTSFDNVQNVLTRQHTAHIVPFNQVRFFAFKVNDLNCVKQCVLQPMISVLLWNKSENIKFISVNGIIYMGGHKNTKTAVCCV